DVALINDLMNQVGLDVSFLNRRVNELSGGQKQRVAIVRALVKNPKMVFADEPTGNLDSETGTQVFDLLQNLSKEKLVVIVSHDSESAYKYAVRILECKDGKVISDMTRKK
ncbi:ATP-binding cassette domain-containing protein, partial [Candidatus Liberibacter asiaticus]|nr:ATP-binding cassette domain-containing protein [Candidatus Liberibacter asiaticus]